MAMPPPRSRGAPEPAAERDAAQVQPGGHRVHQSAAADAAGRPAADHRRADALAFDHGFGDGAGGGAHAAGDPPAFEGRTRGGGSTEQSVAIAGDDFTVGAEVDQHRQVATLVHARGHDARQDVAAHEAAEAGHETVRRFEMDGFERGVRQRRGIQAIVEMQHGRVPADDQAGQRLAAREIGDHAVDGAVDGVFQLCPAFGPQRVFDAGHHVGAVDRLGIETAAHAEHGAGGEVDGLCHQGGGAEVDGDGAAGARMNGERTVVGQDGGFELADFESGAGGGAGVAGEDPAGRVLDWVIDSALQHAHAATAAAALAAAGELHAVGEQQVAKRRARFRLQLSAQWFQADGDLHTVAWA